MTDTCTHANVKYTPEDGWVCRHCDNPVELPSREGFPMLDASARPTSRGTQRAMQINALEKQWDKDLPAYKRLRAHGFQPPSTDGCADLEARATTAFEIEAGEIMEGQEKDINEGISVLNDALSSPVLQEMTTPVSAP